MVKPGVPAAARAFHQVLGLVWSRHGPIKVGVSLEDPAAMVTMVTNDAEQNIQYT